MRYARIKDTFNCHYGAQNLGDKVLGQYYSLVAKKHGCYYLNSSQFIESSKVDGIHLDEPEQEKLGLEVKKVVSSIFKEFE